MPLGLGVKDTFRAIPQRIEVSGHGSSWTITAGSFAAAAEYAATRFGSFAITGHRLRDAWWRRVTLWLTTDPADIARATAMRLEHAAPLTAVDILSLEEHTASWVHGRPARQAPELPPTLEGIFARSEDRRLRRRANALREVAERGSGGMPIPRQRDAAPTAAEAPAVPAEGDANER